MKPKRLLLPLAGAASALALFLAVGSYLEQRANAELLAKLTEFVRSERTEVSIEALAGPGWKEACAISENDLRTSLATDQRAKRRIGEIEKHLGGDIESGEWYLALYRRESFPSQVLAVNPTRLIGFVSKHSDPQWFQSLGPTEFCVDASQARLAKIAGHDALYLKKIPQ